MICSPLPKNASILAVEERSATPDCAIGGSTGLETRTKMATVIELSFCDQARTWQESLAEWWNIPSALN